MLEKRQSKSPEYMVVYQNHSHRREYIKRYFNVQIGRMEQMKIVFYAHFC